MAIKITQIKPEGAQKSAPSAKDYSGEKKGSSGSAVSGSSGRIQITKIPGAEKQRSIAASRKTTRETEHADELDKQTTPSASRQASKQTFGQRVLKGIESGLVSEGANLANLGGVATDRRGGTEMSGVYRRQAETLDKQIAALEKTLKDPTMTAQDIKETNEALAIARSEREKYGKVIESGEKTASGLYDTADKGYSFAKKLSEESTAGTKGIKKGALSIVPAATQIGLQTAERMVAPGMDVAGRALSVAGGNAADYRRKAGEQYDAEKATLRATVSALGVAAGGALSKGVNAAGLKLLRAAGKQNYVLPNIALGGASAVGYAAGETGASELSKAMTDENYTPDWGAIGETALTAFAFGAISSAINAAAITGRNKKYMNELNDAAKERYDYAKRIIEDPRATAEQKAAGAQSVMDAVDKMRYTLDDLQVVGAQKEVDAMREFLLSIYGEMLPYTSVSAGGIGTGASGLAPVAPVGGSIAPVQTGGGMSAMQENAPTAPISPRAPGAAAVMQNTEPAPAPTVGQQNTMPAQPAVTPENAQGTGGGHLTPTQPNAAQGAAEGKADTLDAGKRVNLLEYSNERNAQKVEDGLKDGTLAVDAKENIYRVNEDQHIDRRDSASVGERSVNAFQFDHPELHGYYADAAAVLQEEMSFAQKGGELIRRTSREAGDDEYIRTKRGVSERIARLLDDEGVRYDDIDRSLSAIIHNHGQENFAAAKRVELLLDDMLTNGYTDIHGQHIAPNEAYIAAKKAIPGADMSERTHEELPIYDMPEGRNGGIYGRQEENAGGPEPAEGTGQRADAVAAENDLHGGDRGRRPSEPGAGGAGKLRSTTAEGRRRNRELTQRRREIAWEQPLTSAAALGVQGGTSDETLHVLPEEDWDDELRGFSDWARGKGVKRVTMVTGLLQVETENGPVGVRGIINRESGEMVLRVDGEKRTASEIGKHEVGHLITEEENVRAFMETVRGGADWRGIYEVYERCYEPLTNGYVGMTAEERELYVWEEIMEDAYAGIDSYGQRASRYNEQAVDAIERAAEAAEHPASESEGLMLRAVDEVKSRGPPEKFSVEETDDGRAVAVVDDDILSGIDTKTWDKTKKAQAKAAAKAALLTFKDGIQVNGIDYKVNRTSRREYTRSEDTERLYRKDRDAFADKMRAAANADDIITATTDWTRDGTLTHPRTDSFVDFAHGDVLIQSGNNQYDARVVVGITSGGEYVFYDVVDMEPTSFTKKEETPTTALSNKALGDIHGASSNGSISKDGENVKSPTLGDEIRRQIMGEETEPFKTGESSAKDVDTGGAASSAESVSENGGNVKPKMRFSLDEPVEETKTLVAMHNMTEEKLRRTLDIGAWPAPSIAIVKAKDGHTNYGEYSAVFPRETIDPQRSSKNKVYGGDAWTPTRSNARVEYEVDQSKARALEREIDRLSSEFAGGAFQNSSVIGAAGVNEVTELSLDDIAERLAKYPAVQAAYLQSKGESLEPVYKKKKFDSLGNDVLRQYIDRVGMQEVARLCAEMETGGRLDESALNAAREVIVDDWAKRNARLLERRAENRDKLVAVQKNRLEDWRIEKFIRNAEAYIEQNGTSGDEVDKEATSAKMYSMIAPSGSWGDVEKTVQQWVRPRLDGMLGKPGIYNGKDPYTENGRKPFKETHWDYTAENIVRAMNNASDRGEGMWGLTGGTLTATSAPQYDSVDAIHADEERLRAESDDVHEKRLRDLDIEIDRVVDDLLRSTKAHSDSEYEERHILEDVLAEAAKGEHSPAAIKRSFAKDGYAIKDGNARSIMRLFDIAAKIPVGYFEAKPQRVVGFDEALAVVAPDDAPGDLLSEMRDAGMNVVEYRAGDDADRLDKINSIKNVRFSAEDEENYIANLDDASIESRKKNISVDEAIDALDAQKGLSYRFYNSENPMSRAGYAMFSDDPYANGSNYGGINPKAFSVDENELTDISDIMQEIIDARHSSDEKTPWVLEDYENVNDDEFAALFDPADIVDSAAAYDNEELTSWLWDNVLEPNNIIGIKTSDGAVAFSPDIIKRNLAAEVAFSQNVDFSAEDETDSTGRELTAQQREYFKGSKARDKQGRLLTLYHGTGAKFTVFDKGRIEQNFQNRGGDLGFYFSPYIEDAQGYAREATFSTGGEKTIMEVYLNLKNPLVIEDEGWGSAISQADIRHGDLKRWAQEGGHDGIIVKSTDEVDDDGTPDAVYIAFSPEQIKNVSNETPTDDPDIRFSAEDEDGGEWDKELARMPRSVQEAVQRVKDERGKKPNMQEFPNLDAYLSGRSAQQAAEKAERLRDKGKDEFKGTEALERLGVKIENSAGDYSNVEQLIANDRAAKTIQRETRKAIKRLGATPKEQNFALNIASGLYDEADIPATMNRGKVVELADYYSAEQSMSTDFIRQRRAEINENLQEKMKDLFDEHFDGEFTKEKSGKGISPESGFALYHRTPQRSMRAIFGWKRGEKINEAIFEPVYVNEQERKRFVNRMHDEVRTFKGKDGKEEALTQRERALAQLSIEGKAVEEMVGKSEIKQQIIHAAENLLDGAEMKDAAQEFGLHGKEERELAQRYADWLETKKELNSGEVDRVKVENAAAKYSGLYNEFYAAINDFLVAHGYEPIGFIKGYAPHFQPEAESGKLERALKAIGVDLGAEVGKLPASIAGLTKEFKPNKRYNPFFQHRNGKSTDYDIQKGFEKYVDYLSDVLYHTDDIMRTRAASKYFRKKYAPDEISAQIQQAEDLKFATAEEKELFLKTNDIIDSSAKMSYQAMNQAMEKYTDSLFDNVTQTTKYGDLVTWLDDYANKLAGKQLFNDRNTEKEFGRMSLNIPKKLVNAFARANVAGNLSSALNQTAQLPMIAGELGPKYVAEAIGDITSGKAKGDFADRSDFLTEKRGIENLTSTKGDKFTAALFWPLEQVDYLVSSIAVRGKYRKELAEGKSEKDALRAADRWGRDMMGSRSKGTAPLTFQSKTVIAQMVNLFQVEALNSWEYVTQDLFGPGLREMEEKLGKKEASRRLAGIIVGTLLGAFILNRVDEELYGGTPAQFDVLGLLVGFLASGNGLSTNEQLGVWVDDVWQKMTGERLFGTDEDAGNDKFNLAAAAEDTIYNISNDIPYARNVAGVFGVGDQTLPMPDIYGTAKGIGSAVSDAVSGDTEGFGSEIMRQLMGLAGDTLPGGRQLEKTAQGAETIARGGMYKGSGDNERLQYAVNPDFSTVLQAMLFGRNALSEARDFYAANDGGLSASQTRTYQELVDMGADREVIYDAIQKWRKIDKDDSLTDGEREAAQYELVRKLKLTNEQKERLHDDLSRSSRSYAAAQEAQKQGISAEAYAKYKDATADLTADKDENGKTINGSKKAKVLDAIDKMQLSKKQKDWLYLDAGYSEKDIGKAPWNS